MVIKYFYSRSLKLCRDLLRNNCIYTNLFKYISIKDIRIFKPNEGLFSNRDGSLYT